MSYEPTASHLTEAAMCLWEEVVSNRGNGPYAGPLERHGTVAVRHAVMALADPCCREWNALSEDEKEAHIPYDWGWCPYFLNSRTDWDGDLPTYKGVGA
uniref:Uncharacterized protein n=1 Tax=viral metagenome TaxID=1070528 RepID=A0A6M3XZV2_9ZZZZ